MATSSNNYLTALNAIVTSANGPATPQQPPQNYFTSFAKRALSLGWQWYYDGNNTYDWYLRHPDYTECYDKDGKDWAHLIALAAAKTATAKKTAAKKAAPKKAEVHFDTVIIADEKKQQILEALEQVHQSDLIFEKWGFGETIEKGKGVSLLFWGNPGTGKTLMAQAIANELKRKLNIVAAADIESNMPGQAERNIREHFQKAKTNNAILLFDECDSLIYTRRNVGPVMASQVNELLSQLERFDGVTIFTTNRLGTLDDAVNRRIALKLEFTMPSPDERARIWQRMFPKTAPVDEAVDWSALAKIELTGGFIKNAVLRAARMAATEKKPDKEKKITMDHLKRAVKHEAESMIDFEKAKDEYHEEAHYGFVKRVSDIEKVGH